MRELFVVLNQQRYSRDAVESLGKPTSEKHNQLMMEQQMLKEQEAARSKAQIKEANQMLQKRAGKR